MKRQSKKIIFAIPIVLAVFYVSVNVYISGYSVPATWVCRYQISDTDFTVIRMTLDYDGEGLIGQQSYGPYNARLQTSHKSSANSIVLWTKDKSLIQIYETDMTYGQLLNSDKTYPKPKRGRLLAVASIIGYGQLEVKFLEPRFLQPRGATLPERAVFRKAKLD